MEKLLRLLSHSTELSKQVANALSIATLSSGESIRVEKQIQNLQQQALAIESMLADLAEQYKTEATNAKQQIWERKLLDLTLRNNLLNMKLGKNAVPLDTVDISAFEDELDQGKEFVLDIKELKGIYRTMRTNLEETGANTLFLTLGTLSWCEGSKTYSAPILLMPVEMVTMKGGQYAVRKRDEDVVLNITLIEFLKQNYDISIEGINPLPQDAHGIDVSLVLHVVREAISNHSDWSVEEDSVLGIFSFTKFVMWNDIHTHAMQMGSNPIVRSLIEGRLMLEDKVGEVDARDLDLNTRPDAYSIPVDADSSQLEAVVEAQQGRSFILYGPPGTGKSQTITNLIANALYHNKRILFVAQKKAALDVVESRLSKIGLAPFCLELHSNKMDKKHFLSQLQQSLDTTATGNAEEYRKSADALYAQRMLVSGYVEALHRKQPIGYSLYDCIDRYLSIGAEPIDLPKDFCKSMREGDAEKICEEIKALSASNSILGGMQPADHPLYGLAPKPQKKTERPIYASSFMKGDSLEDNIVALPQILEGIKQQIERGKSMSFISKSTRQYIEGDYKLKKLLQTIEIDNALFDDIEAFLSAANRWKDDLDKLPQWQKYIDLQNNLRSKGLAEFVERYASGTTVEELCQAFMSAFYRQCANDIIQQDPSLSMFNGMMFEQVIEKYNRLTHEFQKLSREELVARLSAKNPINSKDPAISTELTLLRKRIGNKGRGTSIRGIIEQMPHLLPQLCPVMLMSPLSVAQYLSLDSTVQSEDNLFDIVVFDEASQMPTCEAVGAIARGKSVVIVGDPKQMPPTSFFSISTVDDEEADADDMESILDDCISLSMPTRYLGWHYRSKHESLISFSNQNYYDGRLITFPSADDMVSHVTWQHVEGYYDFGKSRTNIAEAEAIVTEIISRMEEMPERSMGVVAFSKTQSDLIEDILNEELAKRPELELHNQSSVESIFVKNLENVQGDERDVILFSVGYGPDKDGKVSMNFGPLNKVGGERRLNVAVSRARYEMKVFSTLRPEHIDERRTNAEGVLGLKRFLKFAQTGVSISPDKDSAGTVNRIAQEIAEALMQRGYDVHIGIGTSICRIDVGIVNPVSPAEYMLGLIIDGDDYFKMKTVRDREIVRPSVLQVLGWKLMHVWTLDWFIHRDMVIKNIIAHL